MLHILEIVQLAQKGNYFKYSHTAVVCTVIQILSSNSKKEVGSTL